MPTRSAVWSTLALEVRLVDDVVVHDPSVPIPAAARYSPAGEPRPPAPISSTRESSSLRCPSRPISGMSTGASSGPARHRSGAGRDLPRPPSAFHSASRPWMFRTSVYPIWARYCEARRERAPTAQWTSSGVDLSGTTVSMVAAKSASGTSVALGMWPSFHSTSSRTSMIRRWSASFTASATETSRNVPGSGIRPPPPPPASPPRCR